MPTNPPINPPITLLPTAFYFPPLIFLPKSSGASRSACPPPRWVVVVFVVVVFGAAMSALGLIGVLGARSPRDFGVRRGPGQDLPGL